MAVPDDQSLMLPVLKLLGDGRARRVVPEITNSIAEHFSLTPEDRRQMLPSRLMPTFDYRAHMAVTYMVEAGLLLRPARDLAAITPAGLAALKAGPAKIDMAFLMHYPRFVEFRRKEDDRPSPRIVDQRVRNRVIEYLDLAGSFEEQREYEQNVPIAYVPWEVINMWEDHFLGSPHLASKTSTAYSPAEIAAILVFHSVWESAAGAIPDGYPRLEEVQALPEWNDLRQAALSASAVFARRGRMPEDREAS